MLLTSKYKFKMPEDNDAVDIADINYNTQIIDDKLKICEDGTLLNDAQIYRINKDSNGIFTTVQWKNKDTGKLLKQQQLSGGASPNYTTLVVTYYKDDGATISTSKTYTINYDSDGDYVGVV